MVTETEFEPLFVPADYGLTREGEYLYRLGNNRPLEFLGFEPSCEDCIMVRDSLGWFFIGKVK